MEARKIKVRHLPTPDELARAAAVELQGLLERRTSAEPFGIALSGGRIAAKFFGALVECLHPRLRLLENVHFFWADERCVPPSDPENSYAIAQKHLFDPLGINPAEIHRIRGEIDRTYAIQEAEAEICRLLPLSDSGQPILNLVILGMGEDGHVASLFPGESEQAMRSDAVYRQVRAVKPPPERITLGYAPIAAAREVWVLASGAGKKNAYLGIFDEGAQTPIKRVIGSRERTSIFQDIAPVP